jgi:hypothetical protein
MQEIGELKQTASERWLLIGDFNLIYRASDTMLKKTASQQTPYEQLQDAAR